MNTKPVYVLIYFYHEEARAFALMKWNKPIFPDIGHLFPSDCVWMVPGMSEE